MDDPSPFMTAMFFATAAGVAGGAAIVAMCWASANRRAIWLARADMREAKRMKKLAEAELIRAATQRLPGS